MIRSPPIARPEADAEARAFYSQAAQYGLAQRVQFFTEIVAQADIKVLGKDSLGLVGSSRYPVTYDILVIATGATPGNGSLSRMHTMSPIASTSGCPGRSSGSTGS